MTILKIGKYIINEKYITYIDLDCDMYVDNNLVNGVCIWFNSEYHIYNESQDKYVDVPHCLRLLIKEDINAIRYYYKSKRKPLAIDLNVLYEIKIGQQRIMNSHKNQQEITEQKLKKIYIDEEKEQIIYSNL